jgi:hypothetical protein
MFLLINYKTKERLLCSWFENEKDFHAQKIHYIGLTNGLGGYNQMLAKGFIDRRFNKPAILGRSKRVHEFYRKKIEKTKITYYEK